MGHPERQAGNRDFAAIRILFGVWFHGVSLFLNWGLLRLARAASCAGHGMPCPYGKPSNAKILASEEAS